MVTQKAVGTEDNISKLERVCKDASICKDLRLCHQDGIGFTKCLLDRSIQLFGTAGLICEDKNYDKAYAKYEAEKEAKTKADAAEDTSGYLVNEPIYISTRPNGEKVYAVTGNTKQMRR